MTTATEPPVPSTRPIELQELVNALTVLREKMAVGRYPLALPSAERAGAVRTATTAQLDDYLVPRLRRLEAPLLVVVGGSTGAGKSTLVNSLVRTPVSPAGVLRPTTRAPVLVCHPVDGPWFTDPDLLPWLPRVGADVGGPSSLQVVSAQALAPGVALLDAPDIDSVVDANRALANRLLAAADMWLFVTTAARYADAVPWDMLADARNRGAATALVLNRVPEGATDEIVTHLTGMLVDHDLADVPLFAVPEAARDGQGLLGEDLVAPLLDWLTRLARSAETRAAVVRQTLGGAIDALDPAVAGLAEAADEQVAAADALAAAVHTAYRAAESAVDRGVRDGALLRGEVLARWQELVGTGEVMRAMQTRISLLRDRLAAALGWQTPGNRYQEALESGIVALVRNAATEAAEQAGAAWRAHPAGAVLLDAARSDAALLDADRSDGALLDADRSDGVDLARPSADLAERVERMVRDWQRGVLELVRTEAGDKRAVARASAYAVNATGLLVMTMVFTATAFIPTGAEVAVAGGTTVAAQKVLEAIFGDQAVRTLTTRARADLLDRVGAVLAEESARYQAILDAQGVDQAAGDTLRDAVRDVTVGRLRAGLPAARTAPAQLPAPAADPARLPAPAADPAQPPTPARADSEESP